jgi:hypothetical protein
MEFSIKEFTQLDMHSKSSIASVIVLMPFWYVSLFLFHKSFYKENDVLIKMLFAFCFSATWYYFNILNLRIEYSLRKMSVPSQEVFKFSGIYSVLFISLFIAIEYFAYRDTKSFTHFLVWTYSYMTAFNILSISVDLILPNRKKTE